MRFGKRLRQLRKVAELSLRNLALRADTDYTYSSKVKNGKGAFPSTDLVLRLCKVLEVSETETDALLARAGRIPPDVHELLVENPALSQLVRDAAKQPALPK